MSSDFSDELRLSGCDVCLSRMQDTFNTRDSMEPSSTWRTHSLTDHGAGLSDAGSCSSGGTFARVPPSSNNTSSATLTQPTYKYTTGTVTFDDSRVTQQVTDVTFGESLAVTLLDFGGQRVFDAVHHFFMTPNCVYVIAFDMRWVTSGTSSAERDECWAHLTFWMNSIIVHASDRVTRTVPPIALVGTHGDLVCDPIEYESISTTLFEKFKDHEAFPFWMRNCDFVVRDRTNISQSSN